MAFSAQINLSELDGSNGFVINGIDERDRSGFAVSRAGDVNGDGIDDVIIGARDAAPNGKSGAGESYVVFGQRSGFSSTLELSELDGSNGFVINGIDAGDLSGFSVSRAGDVNGDGIDDVIIGARDAAPNGKSDAGESYVVFGIASNTAPTANDDAVVTDEDILLSGDVFANNGSGPDSDPDGDALTVTAVNGSATNVGQAVTLTSGALLTLNADGTFTYNPNGQFEQLNNGDTDTDSFVYTLGDGSDLADSATVTITINGITDSPLRLTGSNKPDTLTGGSNNDILRGRNNDDILIGLGGNDLLEGGNGSDFLSGGDGNDRLKGGNGKDTLTGGLGNDTIEGGNGNDSLTGGDGNDTLRGGNGSDVLMGGLGNDSLKGSNGSDIFVLAAGDGADMVLDFSRQDRIGLAGGLGVGDLTFSGNDILVTDTNELLATLTGVETANLRSQQFVAFNL